MASQSVLPSSVLSAVDGIKWRLRLHDLMVSIKGIASFIFLLALIAVLITRGNNLCIYMMLIVFTTLVAGSVVLYFYRRHLLRYALCFLNEVEPWTDNEELWKVFNEVCDFIKNARESSKTELTQVTQLTFSSFLVLLIPKFGAVLIPFLYLLLEKFISSLMTSEESQNDYSNQQSS